MNRMTQIGSQLRFAFSFGYRLARRFALVIGIVVAVVVVSTLTIDLGPALRRPDEHVARPVVVAAPVEDRLRLELQWNLAVLVEEEFVLFGRTKVIGCTSKVGRAGSSSRITRWT